LVDVDFFRRNPSMPESLLHYLSHEELTLGLLQAKGIVALVLGTGIALRIAKGKTDIWSTLAKQFSHTRSLLEARKNPKPKCE
jgi:hypothetical protein